MYTTIKTLWELGKSKSEIARITGHDWKTVSKVIKNIGSGHEEPARKEQQSIIQKLTGAEFNLLVLLLEHAGELVSKEVLAKQGLGRGLQAYDRRIETHMAQIRKKLGPLPDGSPRIKTVRGAGYQYLLSE